MDSIFPFAPYQLQSNYRVRHQSLITQICYTTPQFTNISFIKILKRKILLALFSDNNLKFIWQKSRRCSFAFCEPLKNHPSADKWKKPAKRLKEITRPSLIIAIIELQAKCFIFRIKMYKQLNKLLIYSSLIFGLLYSVYISPALSFQCQYMNSNKMKIYAIFICWSMRGQYESRKNQTNKQKQFFFLSSHSLGSFVHSVIWSGSFQTAFAFPIQINFLSLKMLL